MIASLSDSWNNKIHSTKIQIGKEKYPNFLKSNSLLSNFFLLYFIKNAQDLSYKINTQHIINMFRVKYIVILLIEEVCC